MTLTHRGVAFFRVRPFVGRVARDMADGSASASFMLCANDLVCADENADANTSGAPPPKVFNKSTEGSIVVEAPPGRLGLVFALTPYGAGAYVKLVREESPLFGKARAFFVRIHRQNEPMGKTQHNRRARADQRGGHGRRRR